MTESQEFMDEAIRQNAIKVKAWETSSRKRTDRNQFEFQDHFWRQTLKTHIFKQPIEVSLSIQFGCQRQELGPTDRQLEAVDQLRKADSGVSVAMLNFAEQSRQETDDKIGLAEYGLGHINRSNISNHFRNASAMVRPLVDGDELFFEICFECDWDEDGIIFLFKDGDPIGQTSGAAVLY